MGNRKKQWIGKLIAALLLLTMMVSLIVPANLITAKTPTKKPQLKTESKLDSKLLQAFKKKDMQRYIVILREQVDTDKVALQAKQNATKKSLSAVKQKHMVQQAVVTQLQTKANKTQKSIISYLKQDSKNVKEFHSFFIVNSIAITGTEKSAKEIAEMPSVKSVILDNKQHLIPFEKNKRKSTVDDDIEWNIHRIGVPDLWDNGITGKNTVVANIDSGVEGNHPALKKQYRGFDKDRPENPSHEFNWHDAVFDRIGPSDSDGHGTHTMGTMVGQESDGKNKIGVAPGAKWIAARAFFNDEGYDSYILEAAQWVLAPTDDEGVPHPEKAPDVVNNSWGGSPINNDWFLPMVKAWRNAGIVPVFSVGNAGLFEDAEPGSASAPGNYKEVIAAGATDENDQLAEFSLRGPTEEGVTKPDIVAPGVDIRSSWPGATFDQFTYHQSSGTSMAAPHVTAAVSLMKQVDNTLTVEQIENILKLTAGKKTDSTYPDTPNNGYGYGLLDVKAAVGAVKQGIGSIHGQVTATGDDQSAPTYHHDARKVIFNGRDENFSIQAIDDISVSDVTLHILFADGTKKLYTAKRVEGDHLDGVYEKVVPKDDVQGKKLKYWWTVEDFSGKQTKSDVYDVQIKEGVTAGYAEDFEGFPDGWYSQGTNNSWEWGVPAYGPDKAASGDKVMGTNLRGLYAADSDMSLMMPPVLVGNHTTLRFKNWYKLSSLGQDTGTVFISTDGKDWEPLYQVRLSNERWHEIGLDLSDYAGKKVYIAFHLQSASNENAGWYIDDVQLIDDSAISETKKKLFDKSASLNIPKNQAKTYPQSKKKENQGADRLPVKANVTVEETGWETETSAQNGSFDIYHPPGQYTLRIEAYGYKPETKTIEITGKETLSPKIHLQALPKQKISGNIRSTSGKEIENATIFLLDDDKVEPVKSNENGKYTLEALIGTHTVQVFAKGFVSQKQKLEILPGKDIKIDFTLDRFAKSEDSEIKYDNGSYGKNLAFGKKGNGFAVKMSLDENESTAMLTGAKLQFWADHVPVPGGDDILISVYDATGPDGAPGKKLAGPVHAKAKRDLSSWTEVDLSDLGIVVEDDFYIAYLQADAYPYIPGFVSDGDSRNAKGRSWDYMGGQWFQANESIGNYMIRANVVYGKASDMIRPEITFPQNNTLTNKENMVVKGTATANTTVRLFINGKETATTNADSSGSFAASVKLSEGKNELTAVTESEDGLQQHSEKVKVTLDMTAPKLTIDSPKDGENIKKKKVVVEGSAKDEHLKDVTVNGQRVNVKDNGKYTLEIKLKEGKQKINVVARDLAGNTTKKAVTVSIGDDGEENGIPIENLTPINDVYLDAGESVQITFDSEPDLRATFSIQLPLVNEQSTLSSVTELPMMEMSDGRYVGYWTATKKLRAEGAVIEVKATDQHGNEARKKADGKLYIGME